MSIGLKRGKGIIKMALSLLLGLSGWCAGPTSAGRAATGEKPAFELPHDVAFTGVQDVFGRNAVGDAIVITRVRGTAATIAIGNTYRIDGAYTLASHDAATLSAYQTDTQAGRPH